MRIPGFTAETSLYHMSGQHRQAFWKGALVGEGTNVCPQNFGTTIILPRCIPSCDPCYWDVNSPSGFSQNCVDTSCGTYTQTCWPWGQGGGGPGGGVHPGPPPPPAKK